MGPLYEMPKKPDMTPKKPKTDVASTAAAVTEAATAVSDAAKESTAAAIDNAWKERVWSRIGLATIAALQIIGLAWLDHRSTDRSAVVTEKVEEVKETGIATHKLVNSASLIAAELHLVTSRRLAEITNDPRDIAAADLAEKVVDERKKKQADQEAEEKKLAEQKKK